ncbi:MAG: cation:dicarboxylase symporter family transporter [Gemmatimonadales bacterium]|nr:cation:dicarboxylase symporter family transporter [Gemmatimonadales bacterium]
MWRTLRGISLTWWIVIATILGAFVGYLDHDVWLNVNVGEALKPLSNIFLRMIKSIVVPLVFGALVIGIAGHGDDLKKVGRLAFKSIIYFEIVTTVALLVGLVAVNLFKPGAGVALSAPAAEAQQFASTPTTLSGVLEHTVPQSFFEAAAKNEVLQVVFFAVLFGAALTQVKGRPKEAMIGFCEGLSEVMFKFTGIVMKFAPIGIFAAIANTIGKNGIDVIWSLGKLVGTLYLALIVFIIIALIPVALISRIPIREFWKWTREPWLLAFTTASSEAALPLAMENMEKFGVPRRIVSFVLPTGYSFNLDGSTLYLAVASIFVAQAAGIHLGLGQQLLMMLTLMLTSKGVAAVPRASLVILSGTLVTFGLPLEGVAVILGVDAFMDMARTSVNLIGNCLASVVMARWEGEFNPGGLELGVHPVPAAVADTTGV